MDAPSLSGLIQAISQQTQTFSQLAEAINRLAASNEAIVDALLAPEPDEADEHATFHLDGTRSQ